MSSPYPKLFVSISLGARSLSNRIVSTTHGGHMCEGGLITNSLVRYHARRAAGSAGLLIVFGSATLVVQRVEQRERCAVRRT
jgi:2,4-dienoyl-CoA reductase-like NADH-dependent reductase (Old Yellow Enzyme family)